MANFSGVNFSDATKMPSTEGDTANVLTAQLKVTYIIIIIINSIACPFTVLLKVLVIMAVKTRQRLRTNSNILLACLAATDALTGVIGQPLFILLIISEILGVGDSEEVSDVYNGSLNILFYSSSLHLMFVTFERLLAIKFTMRYSNVITEKNIKIAVTVFWIISFSLGSSRLFRIQRELGIRISSYFAILFILFVALSYMILYRETRHHQKMIKTQQLPQEEVERFTNENKALKTTVFVVCAVIFSVLPGSVYLVLWIARLITNRSTSLMISSWARTCSMLNSLLNPLIYCWRQKEMRKFVFRMRNQVVHPPN